MPGERAEKVETFNYRKHFKFHSNVLKECLPNKATRENVFAPKMHNFFSIHSAVSKQKTMEWNLTQTPYEPMRRSPTHGSIDMTKPPPPMLNHAHTQRGDSPHAPGFGHNSSQNAFPPRGYGHYDSRYCNRYRISSFLPGPYPPHYLPPCGSPVSQLQYYTESSPDATISVPSQDNYWISNAHDTMRATGCTCKKSRYVFRL